MAQPFTRLDFADTINLFKTPPRVASRAKGSTFYICTTTYELLIINKKEGEQAEKPETRQRFLTRQQRVNHDMTKTQPWTYFNILQVFIVWKDVGLRQNLPPNLWLPHKKRVTDTLRAVALFSSRFSCKTHALFEIHPRLYLCRINWPRKALFLSNMARKACFYPDGSRIFADIPCSRNGDEDSVCCGPVATCLSNKICWDGGSGYVRGSCTDPTWKSSACPQFCLSRYAPRTRSCREDTHLLTIAI